MSAKVPSVRFEEVPIDGEPVELPAGCYYHEVEISQDRGTVVIAVENVGKADSDQRGVQ